MPKIDAVRRKSRKLAAVKTALAAVTLSVMSLTGFALACGPFFPIQLFSNRRETLRTAPVNAFDWEAVRLVKPKITYRPAPPGVPVNRDAAEDLSQRQLARVMAMRQASDGAAALDQAGDLPPAVALYTAGAVSFLHGDFSAADANFRKLLALPAQQSVSRAVWAQYMLGRIAVQAGRGAESNCANWV